MLYCKCIENNELEDEFRDSFIGQLFGDDSLADKRSANESVVSPRFGSNWSIQHNTVQSTDIPLLFRAFVDK